MITPAHRDHSSTDHGQLLAWLKDPIIESLMIPLGVIVVEIRGDGLPQRCVAEKDHFQETLFLDASHEPLDVRRQIG